MKRSVIFILVFSLFFCINSSDIKANNTDDIEYNSNITVDVSTADEFLTALSTSSTINIQSDLDFLGHSFTDQAAYMNDFTGEIKGNGYAIKNLNRPLFHSLTNSVISDLIIASSDINYNSSYGIIANTAVDTTFTNVHVIDSSIVSNTGNGASGFVANTTNVTVNNSSILNTYVEGKEYVGGVIARNTGVSTFNNVFIDTTTTGKGWHVGGFIGKNEGTVTINNSILATLFKPLSGTARRGGILGSSDSGDYIILNNVLNATDGVDVASINRIIGYGYGNGSNFYDWSGHSFKKQNYSWLTEIASESINDDFFKNSLLLDEEIWDISSTSLNKLPVLKSASIIDDYISRIPEVPTYIKTVSEYDELIKNGYSNTLSQEYKMLLMQRDLVNNIGYDYLIDFAHYSSINSEFLSWLMTDYKNLSYYTLGGSPDGKYINELNILLMLYKDPIIKEDLSNNATTVHGNIQSDVYKKMFFSIGKGYSITVRFWTAHQNDSNNDGVSVGTFDSYDHPSVSHPVDRYKVFKKLYNNNLLGYQNTENVFITSNLMFENLEVEEMRYVLNAHMDDKTVEWLNWYIESEDEAAGLNEEEYYKSPNSRRSPYTYMEYTDKFGYYKPEFSDMSKFDEWDNKYKFSQFGIDKLYFESPKSWTVFEGGGICWGISKTGADIWNVAGVPSNAVSQPGHLAFVFSSYDDTNDNMFWGHVHNSAGNWGLTGSGGPTAMHDKFYVRMPLTWGDDSSVSGYSASYIFLSQENLNNFDVYSEGYLNRLVANSFTGDTAKQEEILRNTIKINNRDYGAWLDLVKLYVNDTSKTNDELIIFLEEVSSALEYSPLPMYHLFELVLPRLEDSPTHSGIYYSMLNDNLNHDLNVTKTDNLEYLGIHEQAEHLLGIVDTDLASFSFNGEHANEIRLSEEKFSGSKVVWDYSLDGGSTWAQTEEMNVLLSDEDLAKITSSNDIKIHIVGLPYTDDNIFVIDITDGVINSLYPNDLENRLIGAELLLEYYDNDLKKWVTIENDRFEGDVTLNVRAAAYDTVLPSETITYTFTKNNIDETKQYVYIENINLIDSSKPYNKDKSGTNLINGNINNNYYSVDKLPQFITYEFSDVIKLSKFDFLPYPTNTGRPKAINLYGSLDGIKFEKIQSFTNIENTPDLKEFDIDIPAEIKFVKIEFTESHGGGIAGNLANFYEDVTVDISKLEDVILTANRLLSNNNKTEEANVLLETIYKEAADLLSTNYTQENIDEMVNKLNSAITDFKKSPDKVSPDDDSGQDDSASQDNSSNDEAGTPDSEVPSQDSSKNFIINLDTDLDVLIDEKDFEQLFNSEDLKFDDLEINLKIEGDYNTDELELINNFIKNNNENMIIGEILNITLEKVVNGVTTNINSLSEEIELVLTIPEDLRGSDKKFVVLRVHDGVVSVLEDLDNNDDTITIKTNKFSTYTIAEVTSTELTSGSDIDKNNYTWIFIGIALLLIGLIIFVYIKKRKNQ